MWAHAPAGAPQQQADREQGAGCAGGAGPAAGRGLRARGAAAPLDPCTTVQLWMCVQPQLGALLLWIMCSNSWPTVVVAQPTGSSARAGRRRGHAGAGGHAGRSGDQPAAARGGRRSQACACIPPIQKRAACLRPVGRTPCLSSYSRVPTAALLRSRTSHTMWPPPPMCFLSCLLVTRCRHAMQPCLETDIFEKTNAWIVLRWRRSRRGWRSRTRSSAARAWPSCSGSRPSAR
eukprot:COSAG01_NODE_10851_length_2069_cov_2.052311_1_plen_233_part_00